MRFPASVDLDPVVRSKAEAEKRTEKRYDGIRITETLMQSI